MTGRRLIPRPGSGAAARFVLWPHVARVGSTPGGGGNAEGRQR
jgi:hypothetical protein